MFPLWWTLMDRKSMSIYAFVGKAALTLSHGNAAPERGFPLTMLC